MNNDYHIKTEKIYSLLSQAETNMQNQNRRNAIEAQQMYDTINLAKLTSPQRKEMKDLGGKLDLILKRVLN